MRRGRISPVLSMEWRLRFRSWKSILVLMLYLLAIGWVLLQNVWFYTQQTGAFLPARSQQMFIILSSFQLLLIGVVVPGLSSGTISGERERQTLDILLTTPLSNVSILLGKLFSSVSFMLLVLVSTLPLYGIVYIYGGIDPSQLWSTLGFFLFTTLVLAVIGLFYSTLFRRTGVSTVASYATVLGILVGTILLYLFHQQYMNLHYPEVGETELGRFLLQLNPVACFVSIISSVEPATTVFLHPFVQYLWVYGLLIILLFAGALRLLRYRD